MTETLVNGRLGNQIFRNLAVSLIAEKHDLQVKYCSSELIRKLGIELYTGSKVHPTTQALSDENHSSIYNCDEQITFNLDPNHSYFQSKHISNIIHDYLHREKVKRKIIDANPFKERYNKNNDVVVHIRLGDVANFSPGLNYYINTIQQIRFDNLFITTDDKNHEMIRSLFATFPNAKLIEDNEIRTFQFASTCKHVILSHGSFSAIIGYLAYDSTVYYPSYNVDTIWFGDMFSIPNWIKVEL